MNKWPPLAKRTNKMGAPNTSNTTTTTTTTGNNNNTHGNNNGSPSFLLFSRS